MCFFEYLDTLWIHIDPQSAHGDINLENKF